MRKYRRFFGSPWLGVIAVSSALLTTTLSGCSGCRTPPSSTAESQTESETASEEQKADPPHQTEPEQATEPAEATVAGSTAAELPGSETKSATDENGSSDSLPAQEKTATSTKQDVATTRKIVMELRQQASRAAAGKNFGRAFDLTSRAWDASRRFPEDEQLSELTRELAAESERYGAQANAKSASRAADSDTTLIEQ